MAMSRDRFRLACRLLRNGGHLARLDLPGQRPGESPIDWLVRHGLAPDAYTAAEMLCLGAGLRSQLDELEALGVTV